ncbi:MAG: hypothetical protein R2839_07600 [Thermomicrobiales bacterium]
MRVRSIPGRHLLRRWQPGILSRCRSRPISSTGSVRLCQFGDVRAGQILVDGSLVVSPEQTAAALRLIVERNRVVPEGAGATATAAALAGMAGGGKVVALVSGGNIDIRNLVTILEGGVPG